MEQFVKFWISIFWELKNPFFYDGIRINCYLQSLNKEFFFELVEWPSAVLLVLPAWLSPYLTSCWKNTIHTQWIFLEQTRCDFWDCQFQSQSLESKLKLTNKIISGGLRSAHDKGICHHSFRPQAHSLCLHVLIQVQAKSLHLRKQHEKWLQLEEYIVRINLAAQSTSV